MKILVDADACPVVRLVEQVAAESGIPVILVCDDAHVFRSEYAEVITVERGADAADYKLFSMADKGDIVVTQDYGMAVMALGKGAYPIHQSGKRYTDDNIDRMLMERHIAGRERRRGGKGHGKGPGKRTAADDMQFKEAFCLLLKERTDADRGKN